MNEQFIEQLGQALREKWVAIKQEEQQQGKDVPADHLLPWSDLDERNKEIDRQLAVAVICEYLKNVVPVISQMIPAELKERM